MVGRRTASQIAAASAASFLLRLTQGLTAFAGINRTWWPSLVSSRAQWCAVAQASMPTRRRQTFKKRDQLSAPKLLSNNHRLVAVDAVDLKHVLGDIQPDRGNLHVDGSHVIRL